MTKEPVSKVRPLHTTARQFYPFVHFQQELGAPVEKFLNLAGLPILDYEHSDEQIHEANVLKFFSVTSLAEKYDEYVLEVSKNYPIDVLIYSELINSAGSGWSALNNVVRCLKMIAPTPPYWLQRDGSTSWFCRGQHPIQNNIRNMELYVVDKIIDIVESITGKKLRPKVIKLQTPELLGIKKFDRYAQSDCILNQSVTAVSIPHKILLEPSRISRKSSFLDEVRSILASIDGKELSQSTDIVAESLYMSRRTLQRLLHRNHINLRVLYDEEIYLRGRTRLLEPGVSINNLSRQLGFTETSNFTRSFRRITGVSPVQYRNFIESG